MYLLTGALVSVARIKKIINADDEMGQCSNNATFAIAIATEMFIQYLVEQTHAVVKTERKPRKNVQYRDVANAVARIDNLEFLVDVVPKMVTYKRVREQKAKEAREQEEMENEQVRGDREEHQNGHVRPAEEEGVDAMDVDRRMIDPIRDLQADDSQDAAQLQLESEFRSAQHQGQSRPPHMNGGLQ